MPANYHTHTARCHHAWGEDKEYVEQAIAAGMQVLGFSDHCPWIFPKDYTSKTRMAPEMLDDYFTAIDRLRQEYKNDITIYTGFESEYVPKLMEEQEKLLSDYPVDYMILGEHFMENEMTGPYTGLPTDQEADLRRYVDLVIEGMETGKYVYVAHPDLLHYTGPDEIYEKHFLRLCQYLKQKQIPVEINLLGVVEHRHYTSERFLKIAEKAGNSVIIGCDAHTPDRLSTQEYLETCRNLAEKFHLPVVDFLPGLEPDTAERSVLK